MIDFDKLDFFLNIGVKKVSFSDYLNLRSFLTQLFINTSFFESKLFFPQNPVMPGITLEKNKIEMTSEFRDSIIIFKLDIEEKIVKSISIIKKGKEKVVIFPETKNAIILSNNNIVGKRGITDNFDFEGCYKEVYPNGSVFKETHYLNKIVSEFKVMYSLGGEMKEFYLVLANGDKVIYDIFEKKFVIASRETSYLTPKIRDFLNQNITDIKDFEVVSSLLDFNFNKEDLTP